MDTRNKQLDSMCRTCMQEEFSFVTNNKPEQQWKSVFDTIEECGSLPIARLLTNTIPQIKVQPSDELPKKVCGKCLEQLQSTYKFQQMCVQSQERMCELMKNIDVDMKITADENETSTNELTAQEFVAESKALSIEFGLENHSSEARTLSATAVLSDPLQQSIDEINEHPDVSDYVKQEEAADMDDSNIDYSDGENIPSVLSIKEEATTVESAEQQVNERLVLGMDEDPMYTVLQSGLPVSKDVLQIILSNVVQINTNLETVIKLNDELKKQVKVLEEENAAMHIRLLTEITSQRKNFQHTKSVTVLPKKPFVSSSQLDEFEQKLKSSSDLCTQAEQEILQYQVSDPSKFVRWVWKKLFTDELAEKYSWRGTSTKKCLLVMTITSIIRGAFNRKFDVDEKIFNNCTLRSLTYKCPQCNKSFQKSRYLTSHLKRHKEREALDQTKDESTYFQFKCDICQRRFHKQESLNLHRSTHDEQADKKEPTCDICNKTYSTRQGLNKHKRLWHPVEKLPVEKPLHSCNSCGKTFKQSYLLTAHLRVHTGERPFLCPECGKAFKTAEQMRMHHLRHSDVKAYECPHCPLKFRCSGDVSKHKVIHRAVKRHVCDICGDRFAKSNQLTVHKRFHNGEKPFKCDYCEMRFVHTGPLQRHVRTHTGEKPYKCKYCTRAFAQSNDHIKHLRTHLGENVYRCELCPSAFRLASELRTHIVTHKNEDEETRGRNMKALKEELAKLELKLAEKQLPA